MTTHTLLDTPLTGNAVLVTGLVRNTVADFYALNADALITAALNDATRPHFHATLDADGTLGGYLAAVEFATRKHPADDTPQTLVLHNIDDAFTAASRSGWGLWLASALAGLVDAANKSGDRVILAAERTYPIPGALLDRLCRVHAGPPMEPGTLSIIPAVTHGGENIVARVPEAVEPFNRPTSVYPSVTGDDLLLRFTRAPENGTLDALVYTTSSGKPLEWLVKP